MILDLAWSELTGALIEPNFADLNHCSAVIVEAPDHPATAAMPELASWVSRQAVPVALFDPERRLTSAAAFDVVLCEHTERQALSEAIERNPVAASVLVQTLRACERLPIGTALHVESLAYATLQAGAEYRAWHAAQPIRTRWQQDSPYVRVEREESTLNLTLASPGNRNALSAPMRDALSDAFRLASMDPTIRRVCLRGEGPSFCAGGDLSEFSIVDDSAAVHGIRALRMPAQYLARCGHKTIARLHGHCVGAGIELPAFAGYVVAAPDTVFRLPEVGMGLVPGAGGCVSIPRRIGRRRAAWMALTGLPIDVHTALSWGLVDRLEND